MRALPKSSRRRLPRRCGAAAVEAAVVLPVLLTLVLAAVDFGRVFSRAAELSNAVRNGAEAGATHRPTSRTMNSWSARVRTAVLDELSDAGNFDTGQVSITTALLTDGYGYQQVRVAATCTFSTIVSWPLIPQQFPLRSQVTMQQYR